MRTALDIYESKLRAVDDHCFDPWFGQQLTKYRGGDEDAGKRISGSCLRVVLEIAKSRRPQDDAESLLDLVQEGNAVIVDTLESFAGFTAHQFIDELTQRVDDRFAMILTDPDHELG